LPGGLKIRKGVKIFRNYPAEHINSPGGLKGENRRFFTSSFIIT